MQSDQAEHGIATSPLLVRDPALNAYVRGVVCKLAPGRCEGLRIYIVEIPLANAYTMPNGAIVVWTGLLLRMQNEAQLAFILGHEMTHFFRRHTLERFESALDTSDALAFFAVAAGPFTLGLGGLAAALVAGGAFLSYTRDQEREADAGGFDLATAAGYDPAESANVWRQISAEDTADPNRDTPGIFERDHPSDKERLAAQAQRAADAEPTRKDWVANADAYRAAVTPFLPVWLKDEISRGNAYQSVAVFEQLHAAMPNSGEVGYFLGEAYRKRDQAGDAARALDAYRDSTQRPDGPPEAWRALGLVAMKSGDAAAARTDFADYLAHAPQADDRAMIQFYVTQLGGK
jgi:predicted Zn-dependent protease